MFSINVCVNALALAGVPYNDPELGEVIFIIRVMSFPLDLSEAWDIWARKCKGNVSCATVYKGTPEGAFTTIAWKLYLSCTQMFITIAVACVMSVLCTSDLPPIQSRASRLLPLFVSDAEILTVRQSLASMP